MNHLRRDTLKSGRLKKTAHVSLIETNGLD